MLYSLSLSDDLSNQMHFYTALLQANYNVSFKMIADFVSAVRFCIVSDITGLVHIAHYQRSELNILTDLISEFNSEHVKEWLRALTIFNLQQ